MSALPVIEYDPFTGRYNVIDETLPAFIDAYNSGRIVTPENTPKTSDPIADLNRSLGVNPGWFERFGNSVADAINPAPFFGRVGESITNSIEQGGANFGTALGGSITRIPWDRIIMVLAAVVTIWAFLISRRGAKA